MVLLPPTDQAQPEVRVRTAADGVVRTDVYGPGAGDSELRFITIEGAGHHWPGGEPVLNEKIAGPPSNAIDATEEVWKFLKRFTRQ